MYNWFTTKVRYEKNLENGAIGTVTESYLVDALSFAEAEERIIEEMRPYVSGDTLITTVKREKINELFENGHGDKWYKCRVDFTSVDEEKGVEKRIKSTMYVQASKLKEAIEVLEENMKSTLAYYEIISISETPIMEVLKYELK